MLKNYLLISIFIFFNFLSSEDYWQATDFIWNFTIINACNINTNKSPFKYFETEPAFNINNYKNIKSGDTVWIKGRFIPDFAKHILPEIENPFILVISDGDESFPSNCVSDNFNIEEFINNNKIIHIFAQNCDTVHNKITHIPIGLDFHTIAYKGPSGGWGEYGTPLDQELYLKEILSTLQPTDFRKPKAFVDFQLSDTMHGSFKRYLQFGEDRISIFNRLLLTGLIDYSGFIKRSELWKTKGQYAFSISPHGNGLDCHRTWEDLVLGCIVIVKSSALDPLYKDLPVVIIKDWSEITKTNMNYWLNQYRDAFTNPIYREKLTNNYWINKINLIAQPYK